MGLRDEIESSIRPRLSEIERAIRALDGPDRRDFMEALHDEAVPASAISRALGGRGIHLDYRRINEYRNGTRKIRFDMDGNRVV